MSGPHRTGELALEYGATWGAGLGVLFASNAFQLCLFFAGEIPAPTTEPVTTFAWWFGGTFAMLMLFGPTALFCAAGLTSILGKLAGRFTNRKRFLLVGMIFGVPFGLLHLVAGWYFLMVILEESASWLREIPGGPMIALATAVAGGIGIGLGAALAVPFRKAVEDVELNHGPN